MYVRRHKTSPYFLLALRLIFVCTFRIPVIATKYSLTNTVIKQPIQNRI